MATPPTGTVTFMFTDIEGSTRLLQEFPDGCELAETEQARILREAIAEGGGTEHRTEGRFLLRFVPAAAGAVRAAVTAHPHGRAR
jgi:class 3 adenylate cyclase